MSLLRALFGSRQNSASVAKDRLSLIIARERSSGAPSDWLPRLQRDIIEVIGRYVPVDPNAVKVEMERGENLDVLEINIVLPEQNARPAR
ncbi:MAG TPA: cell division topological specificity factor MinE [Burkholderiales bacterium]|nr:cell division topological specificity factor MinE [Burkholderiales bacterium]